MAGLENPPSGPIDPIAIYVHLVYIKEALDEVKNQNSQRDKELDTLRTRADKLDGALEATNFWLKAMSALGAGSSILLGWLHFSGIGR